MRLLNSIRKLCKRAAGPTDDGIPGVLPPGKGAAVIIDGAGRRMWDDCYYDSFQSTIQAGVDLLPNIYKPHRLIVNWKSPDDSELSVFVATISTFPRRR